jgi:ABC-type multidrug transport system fused ATPase/permease subunit
MIFGSALSLLDPLVVKWLIDVALPSRSLRLVLFGTLAFCLIYLASLGVNYLSSFLSCVITQKLVFRIRVSMLRKLHRLQTGRRDRNLEAKDTLFRVEQDVDRVAELSGDILPLTIQMLIMGLMVVVTMGILNWHLTLLVSPILPVFYILQRKYAPKLKEAADNAQRQSGQINAFLQEHLPAIAQVRLLNQTSARTVRFARLTAAGARLQVEQCAAETLLGGASVAVIVLGVGLILGYGGYEVTRGLLTIGGLVAFYGYVFRLFAPVSIAIDLQSRLQRVGASIRRIVEITESPFAAPPRNAMQTFKEVRPDLEFRSVSFSYDEHRELLRNMSFRIEPQETVALVGLNGSGKSTIGLLATGLYEPNTGSILVSGKDIKEISRRSLLATISLIPQDPVFFDETIRENLLFGNPHATTAELEDVAALTQLTPVLDRLPMGFDEPLGTPGMKLSGGEKKRLALARTLLQRPRILIVDEITSSLDALSATGILQALDRFRQGRTLIVVSHRPSTILWAERILVVESGRIVDSGKHTELISRCPAYRRIWESQDYQAVVPMNLSDSTFKAGIVGSAM